MTDWAVDTFVCPKCGLDTAVAVPEQTADVDTVSRGYEEILLDCGCWVEVRRERESRKISMILGEPTCRGSVLPFDESEGDEGNDGR